MNVITNPSSFPVSLVGSSSISSIELMVFFNVDIIFCERFNYLVLHLASLHTHILIEIKFDRPLPTPSTLLWFILKVLLISLGNRAKSCDVSSETAYIE